MIWRVHDVASSRPPVSVVSAFRVPTLPRMQKDLPMKIVEETINRPGDGTLENCLSLLARESARHRHDLTWKTWILSLIDHCLGLGYWWFPKFEYLCRNPDGSIWKRHEVRRTLASYTIAWGRYSEYYDDGTKACEGISISSSLHHKTSLRQFRYWLPDGTKVSQSDWMRLQFGCEVEGYHDPAWEK